MIVVTNWTSRDCLALRKAMGAAVSQSMFAIRLGVNVRTIKRWEGGGKIGPAGLADLNTALANLSPPEVEAFRQYRTGATDLAAGTSELPPVDDERLARAGRADAAAINVVRSTLYAAMELDDKLGSPAAIGLVTAQQALTKAMLRDCAPELRPNLLSLYAEWHGLAGSLAADDGDQATALQRYEEGRELAHDAEDDDLAAYLLCHMSQLAVWQDRRRIAMDHAVAARSWVTDTQDRRLRAYVGIRLADAAARNGQRHAAMAALDEAEHALDGLGPCCHPSESRAYFVGPGLIESYRGLVLTKLGDAIPAAVASRRAVAQIEPTFVRDRAVTLLELAEPLELLGDIDEAAAVIGEAAELTDQNRSPRLANSIVTARHRLSPWAGTKAVRELDEQLDERDMVNR
ncbi:helix-turn-helix domain-containing protein [Nocardia sp. CA-145437]|uniref:helix-turn-helix domain-containing protein n=1 Tax=Nocardia sp. CA-145437 TaxID=3239980 RepID=UPI003D973542